MAAAPEGEGLFADPEPFSPSIFLDLPPTPRPDGNGEVPASSDDLVLPFITRILMEEDINDQFFYQFPDHPVLLQAQEPYAQILSDAATARTNSAASVSPATVSPSSSDDPVQLLMSPPYPDTGLHGFTEDGVGTFFLPAQDGGSPEFEQSPAQLKATTLPAGDGSGSQLYRSLMAERIPVVEYLKAYWLYLAACCFKMTAFRFSNMTILKAIAGRKKVHIVDYGVNYGVLWPSLLYRLANLEGGPPEVRITGIDLPQPGFRPAVRIEETGRRLSNYMLVSSVSHSSSMVLIVNSIMLFGNLMDEGVDIDSPSPRDIVLRTIRKMQPDAFILYVMNVSYSAPFFVTRFREALFFYSAMFDMLDATAPRDSHQRFLVERGLFRQSALNVVACEGTDRVERPETYKQWQVQNHRAGLKQLPLDPDIVKTLRDKVRDQYHKDFIIDTDHNWLLEGWKGRILYAMST
ncbi:unnamed protein product [Miscanthus lutarioriparius]|uniref:Scarecrow-like protein 9 n=1 Tax=Miscanthus lutarioriparius TaxID=422564 RepID=A0A811PWY7_9POAL|nr:unnamed protein product [Miscanthus lutarioriparius]